MTRRTRMSAPERREQLVKIGREVFAKKGFDATSVEEIATRADVTKPVIYEHFGGKEGLYAVIIDREVQKLTSAITTALNRKATPRALVEGTAVALFDYIDANTDGFRILARDTPATSPFGNFSSLLGSVGGQVKDLLAEKFEDMGFDSQWAPLYTQMLVGLIGLSGQWWLEDRTHDRYTMAAHLVNLTWNGLQDLSTDPQLYTIDPK